MNLLVKVCQYIIRLLIVLAFAALAIIPLFYTTELTVILLIVPLSFLFACVGFIYVDQIVQQLPVNSSRTHRISYKDKSLLKKMCFCCR